MLKNLYKRNHGFVKELFLFSYHADYRPVLEPYTVVYSEFFKNDMFSMALATLFSISF